MSVQKFRIKKGSSFTTVSTTVIQSLKNYAAIGLYTYLLSLPADWIFYKSHLAEYSGIGRQKLNHLLKILAAYNLISIVHMRDKSGRFTEADLCVKDGLEMVIPNEIKDLKCAPLSRKPLTVNRSPVNSIYKGNTNKRNIKSFKSSCATDPLFDEFWKSYPNKKNKFRAYEKWKNIPDDLKPMIIAKVKEQAAREVQWKDVRYVPMAATYLHNQRWEDEITEVPVKPTAASSREVANMGRGEPRSVVKEWGRGHPDWDRLYGNSESVSSNSGSERVKNPLNFDVVERSSGK